MATKVSEPVSEENNGKKEHTPLYDMARKVLLAGIGAVALAQEEIEDFVQRLIERGEIAETEGRKLMQEVMDKRKKEAEKAAGKAEEEINKRIESILSRMNVPTKADIDSLSEKILALSKKVDQLKKTQS